VGPVALYDRSGVAYDAMHVIRGLDYAAGAAKVVAAIRERSPGARSLLDVACGTGCHLAELRGSFDVEGLDLSDGMARVAEQRLPGVTIHRGDMRSFELGRRYDAVTCLFSSIGYVLTEDDLSQAVRTMADHVEPGGVFVLEPWIHPEGWGGSTFRVEAGMVEDVAVSRIARSWREGTITTLEMHWTVGTSADGVEQFFERHELALYTVGQYEEALRAAGLEDIAHDPVGLTRRGLFVAAKPA
jgi:SAM-dependent methyltransferase